MLNTKICDPTITATENEIVSEICMDDNFELDEFTIKDDEVQAFNTKSIYFDLLRDDELDDFNFFKLDTCKIQGLFSRLFLFFWVIPIQAPALIHVTQGKKRQILLRNLLRFIYF